MNVLAKHIESLLLEHNCVIVPGLGGFVAGYVAARMVEGEDLFLPPHRQVGFNPLLSLNDGLLVQSYMLAYDVSFPEATAMIEETVAALKSELQAEGELEIGNIGKLLLGVDGRYDFTPNEAGVLSPTLYGLDAFRQLPLAAAASTDSGTQHPANASGKAGKDKNYTLRLNKHLVNYAAAAVIAFLFYFLWATPLGQIPQNAPKMASMLPCISTPVQEKAPKAPKASNKAPEQVTTDLPETTSPAEEVTEPHTTCTATDSEKFTLVLVSQVPLKNATAYRDKLCEEGYTDAQVLEKGKMVRVIFGRFADEAAAYARLNELRRESKHFAEAWVLEL